MRVRIEELFKHDIHERPENGADNIPAFSDEMKERIYSRIQRKQAFQQYESSYNERISGAEKYSKPLFRKGLVIAASVFEKTGKTIACIPKETAKIFRNVTNNTEGCFEEVQVDSVEIYHISMWRRICSAALAMVIAAGTVIGGKCYYSQLKGIRITANSEMSCTKSSYVENLLTHETVTDDYEGEILGIKNWHIEKIIANSYITINYFINDDTGDVFAFSESKQDDPHAYLSDLDNDGNPELICNNVYGIVGGNNNNHALIFRLRNGGIEAGDFVNCYKDFAYKHDLNISLKTDFSDEYDPERNKIVFTSKYTNTELELEIDNFKFQPVNSYPVLVNYYLGPLLGIDCWHFKKENINLEMENTCLIDEKTGVKFVEFMGYKGKTEIYSVNLDNDQTRELICNCQYGEPQDVLYDHVKIYRRNNEVLECGEFIDDFEEYDKANNIELTGIEDFTSKYVPEKNKIILKKQGDDTEYELDLKYFHFKQVDINNAKKASPVFCDR